MPGAAEAAVAAEDAALRSVVEQPRNESGFRCRSPAFWKCWSRIIQCLDGGERQAGARPFLHAAEEMGVRPEDCVVVEDSPAGIDAARRAACAFSLYRRLARGLCGAGRRSWRSSGLT